MADIKQLTVLPRPRTAWQAMDAGFKLARGHYVTLVLLWLGFALPVFALCMLIQHQFSFTWALVIWWWFKPLYELPVHFYLSRALFSETITMKASWKLAGQHFWLLFRTYLTLARLSPARSLTFGVVFLEKLSGEKRRRRVHTLKMVKTRHYLLMLVCLHIEYLLTYGLILMSALIFVPDSFSEVNLESVMSLDENAPIPAWLIATSYTTFISAALVAPFYVAGGFLLYINRRMHLEAWDIEHRFRSIAPRAAQVAGTLLLGMSIFMFSSEPSYANRSDSLPPVETVNTTLHSILEHSDFGGTKTRKVPRLKDKDEEEEDDDGEGFDWEAFRWFGELMASAAGMVKLMLWAGAALFIVLLLYTISRFRRPSLNLNALERGSRDGADAQSHPLTQDLPNDIVLAAKQLLQQGERRQALSVLFRGALRSVMAEHDLKIPRGATESDCKSNVSSVASTLQARTFDKLLGVWQREAYANQPQETDVISALIDDWKVAFASSKPPSSGTDAAPRATS